MPSVVLTGTEGQLRQARTELERALRAGSDVRAESFLVTYAAVAADTDAALELIYTEFVVREELGQKPTPDQWFARFPDRQADLQQVFQVHDELRNAEISHPSRALAPTLATPRHGSRLPARVAGYDIQGELGRGGMGVVYKARQTSLNRTVALKVILAGAHASEKERARFQREAEAAARLDHPNIVGVYEVGEADSRPYCAMEYVPGDTLADRLTGVPWGSRAAAELIAILARAADHAHQRGVIHRDLKPANILLSGPRTKDQGVSDDTSKDTSANRPLSSSHATCPTPLAPKIADFGLAKCLSDSDPGPTRTGDVIGTPSYMAPEQAAARADMTGPATDIWALGIILYEQLTGHLPFRGETTRETLDQVLQNEPVPPRRLRPQLPRDLETICLKCLEKVPSKRYTAAAELADDLERWLRGEPVKARPVGSMERAVRWCRRNPREASLAATIVALVLTAVGLGVSALINMDDARNQADIVAAREREARAKQADDHLQERRRNVQLQVAAGIRRFDEGDFAGAAVYFAAALEHEPDPKLAEFHRIRLGVTLRNCPRLKQAFPVEDWFGQPVISANGSTILLRSPGNRGILVWDVATGQERPTPEVKFPNGPSRVELSLEGSVAVYLPYDAAPVAWDTTTGKTVSLPLVPGRAGRFFEPLSSDGSRWLQAPFRRSDLTARLIAANGEQLGPLLAHNSRVHSSALTRDGKLAATGASDGTIKFWDGPTGEPLGQVLDHGNGVTLLQFSPDGSRLASVGTEGTCQVWEVRTGRKLGARLSTGAALGPAVAFNWDGTRIALAGEYVARVWLVDSGRPASKPILHGQERVHIWFATGDQVLGIHGPDGPVRLWDSATGRPITPALPSTAAARSTDDWRQLVTVCSDRVVRVWQVEPPPTLQLVDTYWSAGVWSPDGGTVVTGGTQGAMVWDPATGKVRHTLRHDRGAAVNGVAFNPDGRRLATRGSDYTARLWDPRTGEAIATLRHDESIQTMQFLPDGRLVTAGRKGIVRFWNGETGAAGETLSHDSPVTQMNFTDDGKWAFISGDFPKLLNLTDRTSIEPKAQRFFWKQGLLSPGGRVVVAADPEGTIRFYDATTGALTRTPIETGQRLGTLAISPDGRRVAADRRQERVVQVWDAESGQPLGLPITHPDGLTRIDFSPDGRFVSVMVRGGTVQVFETNTGIAVTPPLDAGGSFAFATFSPDSRRLLAGGNDRAVRVWDLTPDTRPADELGVYARMLATRRLDERGQLVSLTTEEEQALWKRFKASSR